MFDQIFAYFKKFGPQPCVCVCVCVLVNLLLCTLFICLFIFLPKGLFFFHYFPGLRRRDPDVTRVTDRE